MTTAHVAILYFDGKKEAAKKRLQKLKAAGLIGERTRHRAYDPSVLFLTQKGSLLLRDHGILEEYPRLKLPALERRARVSTLTLRHELEIMDVKAAFHSAIKQTDRFTIEEFSTWPFLNQFEAPCCEYGGREVTVKPDGFIRIHEAEGGGGLFEHTFFLEVDRSSETQDTLVTRAGCYVSYYSSGGFAVRNHAPRSEYKKFPFRVLMVFKTVERRNNTAERLLQHDHPIFKQVYLSTLEEVTADPLGAVWIRPMDYREATKGTRFASEERRETWGYRRQTERDSLVESKLRKFALLTPPQYPG
jgi:hypothetical protein